MRARRLSGAWRGSSWSRRRCGAPVCAACSRQGMPPPVHGRTRASQPGAFLRQRPSCAWPVRQHAHRCACVMPRPSRASLSAHLSWGCAPAGQDQVLLQGGPEPSGARPQGARAGGDARLAVGHGRHAQHAGWTAGCPALQQQPIREMDLGTKLPRSPPLHGSAQRL